jgi:hypothetical protein
MSGGRACCLVFIMTLFASFSPFRSRFIVFANIIKKFKREKQEEMKAIKIVKQFEPEGAFASPFLRDVWRCEREKWISACGLNYPK